MSTERTKMKRKIIVISFIILFLIGIFIAFQFLCPSIVTECEYTTDSVKDYELITYGVNSNDFDENYLKLNVQFKIINFTMLEPRWNTIDIITSAEYEDRFIVWQENSISEDINRLSKSTYTIQIIIDVTGLANDEISDFIEGLTIRARNDKKDSIYETNYDSTLFEFTITDKLREK